jgi:xylulokinase
LDADANCRAVVEAQMMSMRIHSEWMGVCPSRIYATGGASANVDILQVMADVHGCPVYRFESTNSAALGAALRAAHGFFLDAGEEQDWKDIVKGFADPVEESKIEPGPDAGVYNELIKEYAAFENQAT